MADTSDQAVQALLDAGWTQEQSFERPTFTLQPIISGDKHGYNDIIEVMPCAIVHGEGSNLPYLNLRECLNFPDGVPTTIMFHFLDENESPISFSQFDHGLDTDSLEVTTRVTSTSTYRNGTQLVTSEHESVMDIRCNSSERFAKAAKSVYDASTRIAESIIQ